MRPNFTSSRVSQRPRRTLRNVACAHRNASNARIQSTSPDTKSITALFDALSTRRMSGLSELLDDEITYEHRVNEKDINPSSHSGFFEVLNFYSSAVSRAPNGLSFVLDDLRSQGDDSYSVAFHLEMEGISLPWSQTTGTYTFARDREAPMARKLIRIEDTSDLPLQLALPALSLASPALTMAHPLLPTFKEASRGIEGVMKHIPFLDRGSQGTWGSREGSREGSRSQLSSQGSTSPSESPEIVQLKRDFTRAEESMRRSDEKVRALQTELEGLREKLLESEGANMTAQETLVEQQKRLLNISGELKSSKAQVSSLEKEVMDGMLRGMVRSKIAEAEVRVQDAERLAVNKISEWRVQVVEASQREMGLKATIDALEGKLCLEVEARKELEVQLSAAQTSRELAAKVDGERASSSALHQSKIDAMVKEREEEVALSSYLLTLKDNEIKRLRSDYDKVLAVSKDLYAAVEASDQEMKEKEGQIEELKESLVFVERDKAESDAMLKEREAELTKINHALIAFQSDAKARSDAVSVEEGTCSTRLEEMSQALMTAEALSGAAMRERDAWAAQLAEMNEAIEKAQEITNQVLFDVGLSPTFEPIAAGMAAGPLAGPEGMADPQSRSGPVDTVPFPSKDTASPPFALKPPQAKGQVSANKAGG